jgi:transposase InsO family protein
MNREVHVRFWESAGLRCPAPLNYRQEYRDLSDALRSLRRFLEKIYNERRLHSALGYLPPSEFEANLLLANNCKEAASRQLSV